MLSRFQTAAQTRQILYDLQTGKVDLLIAPVDLPAHGVADHPPVMLDDVGLHRLAVLSTRSGGASGEAPGGRMRI